MNNQNISKAHFIVDKKELLNEVNADFLSELRKKTLQFGDFNFEEDVWYCSKYHNDSRVNGIYTIYFYKTPLKYKEITKYFALLYGGAISTKNEKVQYINHFYKFLEYEYPKMSISQVSQKIFGKFVDYLTLIELGKRSKDKALQAAKIFFETMHNFEEVPYLNLKNTPNPFSKNRKKSLVNRIIPINDLKKLDEFIYQMNEIPLVFRTYYWILRTYPNRHSEVASIRKDCLTSMQEHYLLRIPSTKTNGGYPVPEIKAIPMAYSGHSKYIIELIREQQKQVEILRDSIPLNQYYKHCYDFLFIHQMFNLRIDNGKLIVDYDYKYPGSTKDSRLLFPLTERLMNKHLGVISKYLNIDGGVAITTHRFRHNAISDRRNFGYTREQTMQLTDHKSSTMHEIYYHQDRERHIEVFKEIENKLINFSEVPVLFQGKVMNIDNPMIEKALLKKGMEQHLINRLKKPGGRTIGVCGELTSGDCNPKGTAFQYECYGCDWFIPSGDSIDDYKEDYEFWSKVRDNSQDDHKRIAVYENAVRNMALLNRIISICMDSIETHKENMGKLIINNSRLNNQLR